MPFYHLAKCLILFHAEKNLLPRIEVSLQFIEVLLFLQKTKMKIGKTIEELRIAQKITPEFLAAELRIPVEQYLNIEKNAVDITLSQLETIAKLLSSSPIDIIYTEGYSGEIRNYFYNHNGNSGININVQGINQEEIRKGYKELYLDELKRIPRLEKLLRDNNIEYDF